MSAGAGDESGDELQIPTEISGEDILIRLGEREYRVRGLAKNLSYEMMRVNIRSGITDTHGAAAGGYHIDTLDLYQARARSAYINAAATELEIKPEVIKRDLGRVLLRLEQLQDRQIKKELEGEKKKAVQLSEGEKAEALELLMSPKLLDRVLSDFATCGVIGEEDNKLVGYLAAVSRKLEDPLAIIIQSSSAAGKSSLMEAVLAMVPEEDRVKYSAMTGQSLFYMGEKDLKHKVLAIAEEEGASHAAYALKLLQSEGEISIASTGKDPDTGRLVTHEYRVEGPVSIMLTTTAIEIDEELLNRCIVLTVNENRSQTRAIHELQRNRQTLDGLLMRKDRPGVLKVHQNAQRMLRTLLVANPHAKSLTFLDNRTRTRRDHMKYLTLIRSIALLHQYQRDIKTTEHHGQVVEYIEVMPKDVEIANALCHRVLGRSLRDELAPQTRSLLAMIKEMVKEQCEKSEVEQQDYRFTRRQVRDYTGWSDFQLQVHMNRLAALEYVLTHRGGRGQSFVYELLFDGRTDTDVPFLMGLIDHRALCPVVAASGEPETDDLHVCDDHIEGLTRRFERKKDGIEGSNSPQMAPILPPNLEEFCGQAVRINEVIEKHGKNAEKTHIRDMSPASLVMSYTQGVQSGVAAAGACEI